VVRTRYGRCARRARGRRQWRSSDAALESLEQRALLLVALQCSCSATSSARHGSEQSVSCAERRELRESEQHYTALPVGGRFDGTVVDDGCSSARYCDPVEPEARALVHLADRHAGSGRICDGALKWRTDSSREFVCVHDHRRAAAVDRPATRHRTLTALRAVDEYVEAEPHDVAKCQYHETPCECEAGARGACKWPLRRAARSRAA